MQHQNGAVSITEVIVCVQDPERVAKRYGLYSDQPVHKRDGLHIIELELSRIVILSPDDLQKVLPGHTAPTVPFLAGFTVSAEVNMTMQALKERAIDFQIYGPRILVHASDGYGAAVLFEDAHQNG
jgi:hypothetical protein